MTLRIITESPSITQAIKHIHIEIKCKHKFGFNLIEIRHLCVQHYVYRVWHVVLAIRNVLSLLLHIMYFHFTAKRAVIRCPLGPIKRSIAARSLDRDNNFDDLDAQPYLVCACVCAIRRGHTGRKSSMKNAQLLECYFGA